MSAGKYNHYLPKKEAFKPQKHHAMTGVIIILGFFVPPLAVAVRFGIGTDFFINVILTIMGYFPGHGHNFYVQNIRNNANKKRTPKWARKAGFIDETEENRRKAKNQWSGRYEERLPHSTLEGQDYAEDQIADVIANPTDTSGAGRQPERLWREDDEEYYNEDRPAPNQQHWHYPANFEGAGAGSRPAADHDGDRWDRTRAAHDVAAPSKKSKKKAVPTAYNDDDVPEWGRDYGAPKRSNTSASTGSTSRNSQSGGGNRKPRDPDGLDHVF